MKTRTVIFFVLMLFAAGALSAQTGDLTKEEKKYWKNAAKEYKRNPAALKKLSEERDRYFDEAHRLRAEVNMAQTELGEANQRVAQLEESNQLLNQRLLDAQETIRQLQMENDDLKTSRPTKPAVDKPTQDYSSGVVFRIQVGAFGRGKVPSSMLDMPDAMVENAGNLDKVLLGNYRDYDSAKARLAELKSSGYPGAWIVPFKNGVRVSLDEAMKQ